jgi:hypothetical protein
MAISQQPTDLTNTHREIDRISATPAAGTSPKKGGPTTPPEGQHTPKHRPDRSVSRRGTRHREVHAERKVCAKTAQNNCQRSHGEGYEVTDPSAHSKGAPLQQAGLSRNEKSERKGLRRSRPRGHGGHLVGQGRRFASRRG